MKATQTHIDAPHERDVGRNAFIASAVFHVGLITLVFTGLPSLFKPAEPEDVPIAVQVINAADLTRTPDPAKERPRPDEKPEPVAQVQPTPTPPEPPKPPTPAPPPPPPPPPPEPPPPAPPPPKPPEPPPPPPPPPAPIPKAEEPKPPEPPKPAPPKQVVDAPKPKVKPEPPKEKVAAVETPKKEPEKKPPEKFDVDTLLKTLKPNAPAPKSDEPPQKQTATPQQQASVNPQAPRGPQLTTSELDVVKRQIMNRWNYDPGAKGVNEVVVEMRIYLRPDGTVERAEILSNDRMNDPVYRSVAEALRRAALSYSQTPLTLPRDKYETWKTIHITANPKDAV